MNTNQEPVAFTAVITSALISTLNIPALIWDWDSQVVAALNVAIAAWVLVAGRLVRRKVTPVADG